MNGYDDVPVVFKDYLSKEPYFYLQTPQKTNFDVNDDLWKFFQDSRATKNDDNYLFMEFFAKNGCLLILSLLNHSEILTNMNQYLYQIF